MNCCTHYEGECINCGLCRFCVAGQRDEVAELKRQLATARDDALEEAAQIMDDTGKHQAAADIRAAKKEQKI